MKSDIVALSHSSVMRFKGTFTPIHISQADHIARTILFTEEIIKLNTTIPGVGNYIRKFESQKFSAILFGEDKDKKRLSVVSHHRGP